jgi:2,3-bisphosphoglycerate-dependent phosphoglycerate mutase
VKTWRRSFSTPPPPLDAKDERSAHLDPRYASLGPEDVPEGESLKDTIARMMPCWENEIAKSVREGKRLIVAAHGNSLRALVMHLDSMSESEILEFNIPTGVPLVYDLDENLRPTTKRRYLGDASAVAARAAAVAAQGGSGPRP